MDTLTAETRAELRRLVDLRRRQTLDTEPVKAPRMYTRCKDDAERVSRRRDSWRAYYWRNREARCEAQRARDRKVAA